MKYKSAIYCASATNVHYVYTEKQLSELAEITDMLPGLYDNADVESGKLADVEILFSTWGIPAVTDDIVKKMPKLKAIFYAAGATDAFARPFIANGVHVVSAWRMNAIPVAEFCFGQIILALKGYFRNIREVRAVKQWQWGANSNVFVGPGAYGERVALIGAGAISTLVQERLKTLDVDVVVIPSRKENRTISLEEAFRTSFVISNHLPNRGDNQKVIRREHFESMRPGAVFINTGRGAQIDEEGMLDVFEKRRDLTALLDVTEPEPPSSESRLYQLPNVLLSSHIAGSFNDEVHRMSDCVIKEFKRMLNGEPFLHEVQESMLLTAK